MKTCSCCKIEKETTEFSPCKRYKDKLYTYCKICNAAKNRKSYNSNLEQSRQRERLKGIKMRAIQSPINQAKVLEYFESHPCISCGETRPVCLEFDHRDQETKKFNVARMLPRYKWVDILKEIEKCDVLCANCHRVRTSKQLNWWYEKIK